MLGLLSFAAGLVWALSVSAGTSYLLLAGQLVLLGSGGGLTSAPSAEAIKEGGSGSAVSDVTLGRGAAAQGSAPPGERSTQ